MENQIVIGSKWKRNSDKKLCKVFALREDMVFYDVFIKDKPIWLYESISYFKDNVTPYWSLNEAMAERGYVLEPGESWCGDGKFVEEDLPSSYRPLKENEKVEEGDEYFIYGVGKWTLATAINYTARYFKYRTKRPLPKPPIEVDLTMDDLPHGIEILNFDGRYRYNPVSISKYGIQIGDLFLAYQDLRKSGYKWRADNGPWKPFSKTI